MRLLAVSLLCAVAPLAAQRTIVVDAAQGAGFDFVDIPPAIAVARDGDTVLVRAGDYSTFEIVGKAVAVLGEPGAVLVASPPALAAFSVRGLPPGVDVTVSGFGARGTFLFGGFFLSDCRGRILLEELAMPMNAAMIGCAQVVLNRCSWGETLQCSDCNVAISDCVGEGTTTTLRASLVLIDATVTCARSSFEPGQSIFGVALPAIDMTQSTLRLAGDARHAVRAGSGNGAASAIVGIGTLEIDPDVVLAATGGAPPIAASLQSTLRELPALGANAGPLGTIVSIDLAGSPGEAYLMFWARAADAMPFPLLDADLWLDPQTIVLARSGTLAQTGAAQFDFRAPRLPGLVGAPFYWQGVTGTPFDLVLSNPAGYAHRP